LREKRSSKWGLNPMTKTLQEKGKERLEVNKEEKDV
jgi:hypothetical protein